MILPRNLHLWLPSYLKDLGRKAHSPDPGQPIDILIAVGDHFEPLWGDPSESLAEERMQAWMEIYPRICRDHRDSDGNPPVHTFFFPGEQYREKWLEELSTLASRRIGEVEIHIHHGNDSRFSLREKLLLFRDQLRGHRLLSHFPGSSDPMYGFIHGDWALANSGPGPDTCGVPDELSLLLETGCYADFTLPSAPSSAQIPTINRIFFADPTLTTPRPHSTGSEASVGQFKPDHLLLIEGPLTLDWERRKFGLLPRIENGDLSAGNPPSLRRMKLWMKPQISVEGQPNWLFIKLYTHGAPERNRRVLLGPEMDRFFGDLEGAYKNNRQYRLHYVSTREMYNIVRAAMDGKSGNAGEYRDYLLHPFWRDR